MCRGSTPLTLCPQKITGSLASQTCPRLPSPNMSETEEKVAGSLKDEVHFFGRVLLHVPLSGWGALLALGTVFGAADVVLATAGLTGQSDGLRQSLTMWIRIAVAVVTLFLFLRRVYREATTLGPTPAVSCVHNPYQARNDFARALGTLILQLERIDGRDGVGRYQSDLAAFKEQVAELYEKALSNPAPAAEVRRVGNFQGQANKASLEVHSDWMKRTLRAHELVVGQVTLEPGFRLSQLTWWKGGGMMGGAGSSTGGKSSPS